MKFKYITFAAVLWTWLFVCSPALAQETPEKPPTPVTIKADEILYSKGDDYAKATGNVEITKEDKTVTGDFADYNFLSGAGQVEGHAHFVSPEADITGEKATLNSITTFGTLYKASGNFSRKYFFSGEKIDRIGADRYHIVHGGVTSCSDDHPHWRMESGDTDVTVEGYAYMKHMVFRAGGVPIFYLPYFIAPAKTKRATGFLTPGIGYSSLDGFQIENKFFWAISDNMDATVSHQYRGQNGNKYGLEYRYIFAEGVYGNFNGEYMNDTNQDLQNNRDLWKILYDHRHELPFGARNVTHIDMESENGISKQYSDNISDRSRRYTDSYMTFTKNWATRGLNLTAREQKPLITDEDRTIRKLPSLTFTNQKEAMWGSPLYGSFESSYTSYRTKITKNDTEHPFDVDRFDVYPNLTLPITVAPWLNLTPAAGYRATSYSQGVDSAGKTLNENFVRDFYTASLDVTGPKFNRIFETSSPVTPKFKHLITPNLTYKYLPGYEYNGDNRKKVYTLDNIDKSDPANVVTFNFINQLLVKEVKNPDESSTAERARLKISEAYDINEANRTEKPEKLKRPFSSILFDLETKPASWFLLRYATTYSAYDGVWDSSAITLGYKFRDALHFALDRTYKWGGADGKPDTTWDTLYVEVIPPGHWSMDYSIIYDEVNSETSDNVVRVRYKEDCYSLGVNFYQRKLSLVNSATSTTTTTTTKGQDETKFLFTITLEGVGDILGAQRAPIGGRKL